MAKKDTKPEAKTFSLKAMDGNYLNFIRQQANDSQSVYLSMIASDRFAYTVTNNTKFELNPELTQMTLTELEPQPEEPSEPAVKEA